MRWAEHVARIEEERKIYRVLLVKPKERGHLEDGGIGWRI
jgi:hypothetical protein